MQPGMYSPDGQWWWDGQAWRPATMAGPPMGPPGMFWFFSAPSWAGPVLLNGLILLIPVVGQMVLNGWYLTARDNLRNGVQLVPPAGFNYLSRGARVWVVQLIYGLYVLVPAAFVAVPIVVLFSASSTQGLAALLLVTALLALLVLAILLAYLTAAMFTLADARGIGHAANPVNVWQAANANSGSSWGAFGAMLLGGLIGVAIGLVIPFAPIFVQPASYLMAAPALARFEIPYSSSLSPPALSPPAPSPGLG